MTVGVMRDAIERALYSESANQHGLLQRLDPRVKVAGFLSLIVSAALAAKLTPIAVLLATAVLLASLSRISLATLAARVWTTTLAFSGMIALPAVFLTPGVTVYQLPLLHWTVTAQGLRTAGFLMLRTETAATLALLLVFTTPWMHVLKALRIFRAPVVLVVILGMTTRYILLLLSTAQDMFEARRSRAVGRLTASEERRMAIAGAGVLLTKSFQVSGEVYLAMQSRGFRGEVYLLDEFKMQPFDWAALAGFAVFSAWSVWAGR